MFPFETGPRPLPGCPVSGPERTKSMSPYNVRLSLKALLLVAFLVVTSVARGQTLTHRRGERNGTQRRS